MSTLAPVNTKTSSSTSRKPSEVPNLNQVSFVLPGLPTSRNRLYYSDPRSGGAEWSRAALQWKAEVRPHIPPFRLLSEYSIVRMALEFHYPWYTRSGDWLVRDVDNLIKIVQDTVAKKCGFNDLRVKRLRINSVDDCEMYTKVVVREMYLTNGRLRVS